ncbi:hypothetical protein GLYMA_06G048000v4 [Glycine max]|uniref:Uncharacterized protein n=1 Tax=Glycine max TaxID=3847 RepID=A0A0R0JC40_SOYBN|nr:hypothetical protein GYH30_014097 [Glycine max]KRH52126.1 hypothetical protein GLYMA_06G048000v4 [Glycine max]
MFHSKYFCYCFDSWAYDLNQSIKYSNTLPLSYAKLHTRYISYSWNMIHFQDALVVKSWTHKTLNLDFYGIESLY